jgi:thioester reductase-like protein
MLAEALLERTDAVLHCLVRAPDLREATRRLRQTMEGYRLTLDGRLAPVPGDLTYPRLGLSAASFAELANSVDTVFHLRSVGQFHLSVRRP